VVEGATQALPNLKKLIFGCIKKLPLVEERKKAILDHFNPETAKQAIAVLPLSSQNYVIPDNDKQSLIFKDIIAKCKDLPKPKFAILLFNGTGSTDIEKTHMFEQIIHFVCIFLLLTILYLDKTE
jgi:hypothetical protein